MKPDLADLLHKIQEYLQNTEPAAQAERVQVRYEVYQEVADAFLVEAKEPQPHIKCRGCGGEGLGATSVGHTTPRCVFVNLCLKWGVPVRVSN